jgi:hypothetical protein
MEAPDWATQRAQGIVSGGETIQAVWTISDENRCNAMKPQLAMHACPCFLPQTILCAPCICAMINSQNEAMKTMVYVLTDKRLYQSLDKYQSLDAVCCTQGVDNGDVELKDINSVGLDMPGAACGQQCCPTKFVVIGLPMGHPLAKLGGGKHIPATKMAILVDDPPKAARMIREAKDAAGTGLAPLVIAGAAVAPMQVSMYRTILCCSREPCSAHCPLYVFTAPHRRKCQSFPHPWHETMIPWRRSRSSRVSSM